MEQNFYTDKLLALKENFSVKIISGLRGVGKTTLLKHFAATLQAQGEDVIFIDCEENPRLKTFQQLYEFVDAKTAELEKFYLLIDEIDRVDEWEKAINALFVGAPAEIYVTGSSQTLAEKISELLPENYDVLKMSPLSFAEYKKISPTENALENYLHFGAMPAVRDADDKSARKILRGLAYEIIFDLVEKNSISDASLFRMLIKFLARNVGNSISVNEFFRSLGEYTFYKSKNFMSVVLDSGLFAKVPRFDIKANSYMIGGEKFYCADNGILSALAPVDDEKIFMENAVCNELLRRGFELSTGRFGTMHINFVATKGDRKIFIQVLPSDGSITVRRITRPLRALPADCEKILISTKRVKTLGDVQCVTLKEFLSED